MLKRLQQRWKVNSLTMVLVLCTFALGGSLCGYAARRILLITSIEKGFLWVVCYIIILTILWPMCVLLISIPMGQFLFFKKYLTKMGNTISGNNTAGIIKIAVFASGAGSNAKKIIEFFNTGKKRAKVVLVVCNKPGAGVLKIAHEQGIETMLIEKTLFFETDTYIQELSKRGIGFIVLAGFLWKVPSSLIKAFPDKIVNIHPALLPKYGGKGMYGNHVHDAVVKSGDDQSGITIHYVDELYDHGNIIFQATCPVTLADTAASLAEKIHGLEHLHYAPVIEKTLNLQNRS